MKRALSAAAGASLIAVAFIGASPASAAPITCPNGQTVTKTDTDWKCINGGDNETGAGRHKGNNNKI